VQTGVGEDELRDTGRLQSVSDTGLGSRADGAFDAFARLVCRFLDVPTALVSLVDDERQFFPGAQGLDGPAGESRETPLSHSLCQMVVRTGAPLVVADAAADALTCTSLAVSELGVAAYAGMPLRDDDGRVLGSLCAIDVEQRRWTQAEIETLRDLADACSAELRLRIHATRASVAAAEAREAREAAETARDAAETANSQLALVASISRAVTATFDPDEAARRLARLVVPALADWCVADLIDEQVVHRVTVVHRDLDLSERAGRLGRLGAGTGSLTAALNGSGRQRLSAIDRHEDRLGSRQEDLFRELGLVDAVVLPLRIKDRVLGALTVVRLEEPFSDEDLLLADEIAARLSLAIDNGRLYQQQRNAALSLQSSLLTELPTVPGLELAGLYRPASEGVDVGGDWYDAFGTSSGATMIAIGDVVGHDLKAAGQMGQLRAMLRALVYDAEVAPSALLSRLDATAAGLHVDALATGVLGSIAPTGTTWTFTWSNAGHLPPLVLRADGEVTLLEGAGGLMLGVDGSVARDDDTIGLGTGDTVVLYTDGLVETRSSSLTSGLTRLRRHAAGRASLAPDALIASLLDDMVTGDPTDDTALLAVRIR
jgi:serine phosphatase RsbU (regulator of sigma subunit)